MRLNILAAPLSTSATTTSRTMIKVLRGGAGGSSGGAVTCGGAWCGSSIDRFVSSSFCMIAGSISSIYFLELLISRSLHCSLAWVSTAVNHGEDAGHEE